VLGDDVNLAARLMQMARPDGQILASGWLQEAARRIFVWEELAAVQVKGKNEPVPIAALLDVAESQVSSLAVQAHPLVGRQAILDQLVSAAARLFETPPGFAGAVIMDGEAGVGKTRLAQELRFRLENQAQPMVWVECPADPILGLSLYPFKHWLRARFDQDNQLSAAENQARFDEGLNNLIAGLTERGALDLAHECDRTRSMLAAMLGLRQSNSLYDQLEPRLRFENMLQALRSFILAESLCRPMVLHFEDAHHLDPDSQAVLRLLARGVEGYPLLLLLTGRYCDQANQECFSFQSEELPSRLEVQIKELSTAEICRLARYILNPAGAPELEAAIGPELAQYLSEKTNGNPLFVEEILLELSERKLLEQQDGLWRLKPQAQAEVPAGLTGLLITRLDRLDNVVKMGVQTAAVLGREFDAAVLDDMLPGDGISHLLESGQVTQIWSASGAHRFSFRQSMLRDAAYTMQPQSRLQSLHHQAASSIQQVYVQDLPRHYADLAYHYSQAQDDRQALHFARLAGTAAAAEYANRQAIQLFLLALERAQRLPDAETIEDRQAIHAALGELLLITGQRLDAGEHLQAGLSLAEERGDRHAQARFYRFLARLSENQADYPQALHWIEAGLQALGDDETDETSELLNNAGLILSRQGELAAAQAKAERCLLIANRLERPATRARACNLLGHIARLRGDNRQAVENFSQALALYRQANDLNGQAISFNQMATALFNLSEWREANGYFSQAREMFEKIGDPYHRAFTDNNLGWIALNQGRLDEALVYLQGGLATLEQVGASPYVKGAFHSNLGLVYMRRGELQQAAAEFDASQALFEQAGARDFLPELNRNRADLALLAGDLPHAEAFARTALELAQTLNIRLEAGHSLRVLGEIAAIEGHFEQALEHYQNSYQIFLEMGEAFGQARTLIARARLPIPLSDQEKAALQATLPVLQGLGAERELAQARSALG
jgi:predicted ATPase